MLDYLDRGFEHVLIHYRWLFVVFFLLPISVVYEVFIFARNWLVFKLNTAPLQHDKRVRDVQRQVREWKATASDKQMCTARPGWQTMSFRVGRYKSTMFNVKVDMYDILEINKDKKYVRVEPMVTMGQLSRALNPLGWSIPVVPEIDDLTVGGLINGTGVETSSHKYGLFQHTCRSFEVVLSDGSVVKCSREENSDLFYALPWSHGTLGFLVSAEIDIIPTKKLVELHYQPFTSMERLCDAFRKASNDKSNDFVEALMFSLDRGVVMTGVMVDDDGSKKVNAIGRWYKPWFFEYVKNVPTSPEYIPLRDYYHRHTKSLFWELQDIVPFGNNPLFRFFLGWTMPPKVSLLKLTQTKAVKRLYEKSHIIQDMLIPMEKLEEAIKLFHMTVEVYPIWLCPFKLTPEPGFVHSRDSNEDMYVDVGVYGVPRTFDYEAAKTTRVIEKVVSQLNGYQMLYADTYTTRDEFRKIFDHTLYDKMRKRLDCEKAFPEVYGKFFVVAICLSGFSLSEKVVPKSTREYIDFKLKETKDLLIKTYADRAKENDVPSNTVDWEQLWTDAPRTKRPRAVSLSDQMFIIDGKQVFSIDLNPVKPNDNIHIVGELDLASAKDGVKFVKKFSWNGWTFLLVCQEDSCTNYQGTDISHLERRQIIQYKGLFPVDACFFTRDDHVYLIISYKLNNRVTSNAAPSRIYQWSGETMKFTTEIPTPTVRAVSTFNDDQSTMLLFALEDNLIDGVGIHIGCIVYELKDNNEIEFLTFLPDAGSVTSIHPYNYDGEEFALLTSDDGFRGIFLWDGTDLQKWISVPNIKASSLVSVVDVKNETLLFVCNTDALHIYRIVNRDCIHLNDLILSDGQRVVEIAVWEYENSFMLVLIKLNPDGTYSIELWQLTFHDEQAEAVKSDDVWNCFTELKSLLDKRTPVIENMKKSWSKLAPVSKNSTTPLQISELFLDGGSLSLVEFDNPDKLNVSSPSDINDDLMKLEKTVDAMLNSATSVPVSDDPVTFSGKVEVEGDAIVDNLYIDSLDVEYLNDQRLNMDDFLISGSNQSFGAPLEAETIYIDRLEVPSLCGLDSDHWLRVNDRRRTRLDNIIDRSMIYNDTISLDRDLTLNELNAEFINGVNITDFLDSVFVIGKNQVIRGNLTYKGLAQVSRLTASKVNNVSSTSLITRYTNQSLGDVYIETLSVNDLRVEKINGVPIDQAARMSQENVVKGKITIGNLIITDETIFNDNVTLPFTLSTQLYDEILINGDVYVNNLEIEDKATLTLGDDILSAHNIRDIVENSWSKSSDQTIKNPISFLKGASIDELSCRYLNGLGKDDFLYVDEKELTDLENVTFMNFRFDTVVNESIGIVENFYEESSDMITFHRTVRFSHLTVDNIIADTYNGIPISKLMEANDSLEFTGVTEFEAVRVDGIMTVDDLRVNRINQKYSFPIHQALMTGQDLYVGTIKANAVNMRNVQVENLNGHDLEKALLAQIELANRTDNVSFTIDGALEIEDRLEVDLINDREPLDYIDVFKDVNLVDLIETKSIENLRIAEDLNVATLNGQNIEELFDAALSKSSRQIIPGEFEAIDVTVKYLNTEKINDKKLSELMYTDEPCVIHGNVSFSELRVHGDIVTKTLKGKLISEIQEEQRVIPINDKISLHVFGEVTWDESSNELYSVSYLLNNAVTKHEDQVINGSVTFQQSVAIDTLHLRNEDSFVLRKIKEVIDDAVLDSAHGDTVVITGTKIFKNQLTVSDLVVTNNIDVRTVNDLDFEDVTSQIFQKYKNDTVSGQVTFLAEVEIGNLVTSKKIHGVSLYELATIDKKMPEHLHFDHLVVQGNVSLFKLDGVEFDAFNKKRIDIREDHEIHGDVLFDDTVEVKNESFVFSINGIRPTNLVQNDATGIPNIIYGNKVFESEVLVLQDVETTSINNISISEMFENSIYKDQNVTIEGSLIFENDVEVLGNMNVSGHINNVKPDQLVEAHLIQMRSAVNVYNKEESLLENSILKSQKLSLPVKVMLYLEKDESLDIQLPGVYNIKSTPINSSTRLDVYARESGDFCGLPFDCLCRRQYVVEISSLGNHTIKEKTSPEIAFNFYESNRLFGLKVVTASVSSNERCSKQSNEPESTRVFWVSFEGDLEKQSQEPVLEINGFVADAQAFLVNDRIYLILAIFYDKAANSHAIDSLVYELDVQTKKVIALQHIATDGAKALHVFRIVDIGVYMLIGCVKGKAESLLFRFNPDTRQNLYFDSRVTSLNVFYAGDFDNSDALVAVTTKDGSFYVYEYLLVGNNVIQGVPKEKRSEPGNTRKTH
ncbi:hypothetical protein TSAR_013696 [Trichomalopsis sarcophagae]|uniref:Delta(24)-sterol reductase n=1 Tax=Trichomalopsis sarcophagae TaxID=543379 RepID=A0A232F561_9HYME|nr:hypothetical protein TSAR_013696 [Trichomalopsis sarcophagae]